MILRRDYYHRWLIFALLSVIQPGCKYPQNDVNTVYRRYLNTHLINPHGNSRRSHH